MIGAQFLHSLDGGNTWTQATTKPLEGFSPLGLSVLPDGTAFAALDNTITQTSAIAVYVLAAVRSGWEWEWEWERSPIFEAHLWAPRCKRPAALRECGGAMSDAVAFACVICRAMSRRYN